ncbi:hypothetical protein HELRODRAFT_115498 [Helobdella robusta]|uniref:Zinc transporter 1 n=1 Tax=Helobdella robusta TaxID=6412 RepID=T1EG86_HELRO|nr:hypothetical protein HELRODRAFT_115498 [Helobdella robusta]ESN93629.1 hypothetical protein HELRODRAFT_115498 [Helobdella robusta]
MASCRSRMGTKTCRLSSMLTLTLTFFLVELIVGHVTHSLALIGDSYHMLSDVVALIVGIASLRISKLRSHKNTYGWARAEVVGALINSVFLIALCFTILTEAIERFTNPEKIEHPHVLLYVGIAGFVINLIGLLLLHGHAHGHSHGGSHSHNHPSTTTTATTPVITTESIVVKSSSDKFLANDLNEVQSLTVKTAIAAMAAVGGGDDEEEEDKDAPSDTASTDTEEGIVDVDAIRGKPKIKTSTQLNMRGVFLHVLGDALGSVVVIISAICIIFIEQDWKYFIDPVLSLVLVAIVLSTTIPLLRESALILLQTVPTHIKVSTLKDKLLSKVSGVLAVHEFHVWQLAGSRIIASAHIRCQSLRDYMRIAEEVKSFFHNEGIHSTTIQPEFVEVTTTPFIHPFSHSFVHSHIFILVTNLLINSQSNNQRFIFVSQYPSKDILSHTQ